ncbi:MAG: restriction endonuclease subunit S, partial [Verrucomicrobiaceae bacterium]
LPENSALLHVGPEHISSGSGVISWERVRSCHEDGVQSGKYHFQSGDIIFSKIRPNLNKVAIADRQGMCSADMYALVPDREQMTTEFLHFILGGKDFLKYAETVSNRANIPKLNRSQLLAFQCPVPELASQRQFSDRIALIQNTAQEALQHQSTTQSLFASLQDRAFRGEL